MPYKDAETRRAARVASPDKHRKWGRESHARNREKRLTQRRTYYDANRERLLSKSKAWHAANPEHLREYELKRSFGITAAQYAALLDAQGRRCAICMSDSNTGRKKHFCVDHCHETGRIRGLLCDPCNRAIGLLKDDPAVLQAAISYLNQGW